MQSATHAYVALSEAFARMSTTRANGHAGMVADVATGGVLIGMGLWRGHVGAITTAAAVMAGLLIFSFIEYASHRWVFHGTASAMQRGHHQHHVDPLGYDSLPFFVAPLLMLAATWLLSMLLPTTVALLLMGALACGYAIYGLAHLGIHHLRFSRPLAHRWAALHHIHHAHPDRNFGVTTPLWDVLLHTRYVSKRKRAATRSRGRRRL